jgi:hypothetical protein
VRAGCARGAGRAWRGARACRPPNIAARSMVRARVAILLSRLRYLACASSASSPPSPYTCTQPEACLYAARGFVGLDPGSQFIDMQGRRRQAALGSNADDAPQKSHLCHLELSCLGHPNVPAGLKGAAGAPAPAHRAHAGEPPREAASSRCATCAQTPGAGSGVGRFRHAPPCHRLQPPVYPQPRRLGAGPSAPPREPLGRPRSGLPPLMASAHKASAHKDRGGRWTRAAPLRATVLRVHHLTYGADQAPAEAPRRPQPPPPPPPSRTKWTRLVHPSVLIGHVPWVEATLRAARPCPER